MAAPHYREIIEGEEYKDQIEKLGGEEFFDQHLRGILWSLACKAEVWPAVPGYSKIRIAYTDPQITERGITPALYVWFEILETDQVLLLYIDVMDE